MEAKQVGCAMASGYAPLRITLILTIVEKVILGIGTLSIELPPPMLFTDNEVTGSITK